MGPIFNEIKMKAHSNLISNSNIINNKKLEQKDYNFNEIEKNFLMEQSKEIANKIQSANKDDDKDRIKNYCTKFCATLILQTPEVDMKTPINNLKILYEDIQVKTFQFKFKKKKKQKQRLF